MECINESQYIALRDDGFSTYQGNQIPKESKTVNVKQEIVSTFFDEDRIGLVFKNNNKDDLYTMEVYNMSGQLKFRKNFNVPYTTIKMSGGNIVMYNSSQICVMNSRGVQKYMGSVDGTIRDFFKIGWNKYLMVLDTGVSTIKFKMCIRDSLVIISNKEKTTTVDAINQDNTVVGRPVSYTHLDVYKRQLL